MFIVIFLRSNVISITFFYLTSFYLWQRCYTSDMDERYPVEVLRGVPGSMLLLSASSNWKLCCSSSFSSESFEEISPESLWEVCDPLAINHL